VTQWLDLSVMQNLVCVQDAFEQEAFDHFFDLCQPRCVAISKLNFGSLEFTDKYGAWV
jgi:hypothetical protein